MDFLDVALVVLLGLAVFSGYRRGAVLQVLTLGGMLVGLLVGALIAPRVAALFTDPTVQSIVALVTFLAFAAFGDVVGWMVGARLRVATRRSRLAPVDAAGGSVVAVVALLLATWFIALNLAGGPWPPLSREIRNSAIVRTLDRTLPEPPAVLGQVRQFLNEVGFPQVFAGLPPAPGGPVKPPTNRQAEQAFRSARDSTLKVVGQACGRIQEGSSFVVANGYVVTNAHVVAGVRSPQWCCSTPGSTSPCSGFGTARPGPCRSRTSRWDATPGAPSWAIRAEATSRVSRPPPGGSCTPKAGTSTAAEPCSATSTSCRRWSARATPGGRSSC